MPNTIKLKRSAVAGKAPAVGDLQLGELALNTTDGKLYTKKSVSGTESIVELSGGGSATMNLDQLDGGSASTVFSGAISNVDGGTA